MSRYDPIASPYPGIRNCTLKHEKTHLERRIAKGLKCDKCGVYAPRYYPLKEDEEECWAYLVSVDCLKSAMYQQCGVHFEPGVHETDERLSDCARAYILAINGKIRLAKSFCGSFLDWEFTKYENR
jgi:hypothetical protein